MVNPVINSDDDTGAGASYPERMSWPRPLPMALVVGGAGMAGAAWGSALGGPPETLFLGVVGAALAAAVLLAVQSIRRASWARQEAGFVGRASQDQFVERLIAAERERLGADVERELRARLAEILRLASHPGRDLGATAARVHAVARAANTELRRQLGLLRQAESTTTDHRAHPAGPSLPRADLLLGVGAALLALAETIVYPLLEGVPRAAGTMPITVAAASTVIGRRVAPGVAAVLFGALWLAGALLGGPVQGGFWLLLTAGALGFALGRRGGAAAFACWCIMAGAMAAALQLVDPENLTVGLLAPVVAGFVGLIARHADRQAARARTAEAARREEIDEPLQRAFTATRDDLAREVHDTVSHAVGVIAVHAGAAEVSWRERPEGARQSLGVIADTARAALAELPRPPGRAPVESPAEVAERFREAGLVVTIEADPVPPEQAALVSRLVREGLTNVLRHAGVGGADVRVAVAPDVLTVSVSDDGNGAGQVRSGTEGFGLVGIRERVALAGGSMDAGPLATGRGFRVSARVPLARRS